MRERARERDEREREREAAFKAKQHVLYTAAEPLFPTVCVGL